MPIIPNFPQQLLEEHMHWHHANHYDDPSQLPPGYGQNFLNFHRQFINKVYQWYSEQGYDPRQIAGWQGVPEPIRNTSCYNRAAEARVLNNPRSFATADQLGLFIEGSNLHGCIHQEAARIYGESALNDFDEAPRTTMFYNIHGMIDEWYKNWERAAGIARGTANKSSAGGSRGRSAGASRTRGAARAGVKAGTKAKRSASVPQPHKPSISGAAQRGPLRSGPQNMPGLPLIHEAARHGTSPNNKKPGGGRNRKP